MIGALAVAAALMFAELPRSRKRTDAVAVADIEILATLLILGLDAGMTPALAIAWSGPFAHPELALEIAAVIKKSRLNGLSAELRGATGHTSELFHAMARATESGAAVSPAVTAYQERLAADSRAAAEAKVRRLPVKLMFPLALLMLPGLVLMISGPALIEVLQRLS